MTDNQSFIETAVCEQTDEGVLQNSSGHIKLVDSNSPDTSVPITIIQVQEAAQIGTTEPELDLPTGSISYITELNSFKVEFDYYELLVGIIKALPNRRFDPQEKRWYVNVHITAVVNLRLLIEKHCFGADEDVYSQLTKLETEATAKGQAIPLPLSQSLKGDVELQDGKIAVRFHYDPKLVQLMKKIGGGKWNPDTKSWIFALTSATQLIAALPDFYISPAITESINNQRQAVAASQAAQTALQVTGLGGELHPFQRAGVAYALWARQCFIADEPGLGKTIQALATIHAALAYPALVVCPASLKLNWEKEALHWLPEGKTVALIQGASHQKFIGDLLIINYEILGIHQKALQAYGLKAIVLDESQAVKNYRAQRTKTAKEIAENIEIRLCLTGTPVLNRPQELISQLQVLGRLDDVGGFNHFIHRYCNAKQTEYGWDLSGAANLEELNDKLRSTCYIRRKKADVLGELPAKQRAIIPVEISNRKEYKHAEKDLIAWLRARASEDKTFLISIKHLSPKEQKKLKQQRADSTEERARRALQLVRIEALKQLTAKGKLIAVQEWIESFLETGEKLLVFAYHNEIVEKLAKHFNAPSITGDTPFNMRQTTVENFQINTECKLLILNLQVGGVGLTLTAASNVAFVELGWTPAVMDQATDRTHRIGQQNQVTAWYLLAANTIDEQIDALIERKRLVVNATTDGNLHTSNVSILNELIEHLLQKQV